KGPGAWRPRVLPPRRAASSAGATRIPRGATVTVAQPPASWRCPQWSARAGAGTCSEPLVVHTKGRTGEPDMTTTTELRFYAFDLEELALGRPHGTAYYTVEVLKVGVIHWETAAARGATLGADSAILASAGRASARVAQIARGGMASQPRLSGR